jgi:hypothetical protein
MKTENDLELQGLSDALEKVFEADRKAFSEAAFRDMIEHKFYQLEFEISCLKERVNELEQALNNE